MTKTELSDINGKVDPWGDDRGPYVIGNFNIVKTWKGDPLNIDGVVTHTQSSACGIDLVVAHNYLFFINEKATDKGIFTNNDYGVVSICGGPYGEYYELYAPTLKWLNNQ